ncbi:riboflavin kinase [Paramarasmius palmivorus]|uniref:Riboflavin kinase n=1 Tax=Paramarasmius palmivorus TaxID=297713 RepID=A0AAW0E8W7_9AGAR
MSDTALGSPQPPPAPFQTQERHNLRPEIVGPESPESPYPIRLAGPVQKGFGRGGKDLGCPTANLPDEAIQALGSQVQTGVYYGYAQVLPLADGQGTQDESIGKVLPMVMSIGWNPYYKNERLTAEVHIMHEFKQDFYGNEVRAIVLGYIRPELDYTSLGDITEALIEDIETDKRVALNSLNRPEYQKYSNDSHFVATSKL